MLTVTILGNNSAVPAFNRHPTSQVVSHNGNNYLVDCGEGTQIQMIRYKVRRGKISHVFISHLHGDHYYGLIGLINTFGLLSHLQDLHIFGPAPLQQIIELQLKVADTQLPYALYFHPITGNATLVDNEQITIKCFQTDHRITTYGFTFEEKSRKRKLLIEKVREQNIPVSFYSSLQEGMDYIKEDGTVVPNSAVTTAPAPGKKYAFCADTRYDERIIAHIQGFDAIYHETTYLDNLQEQAYNRFHATTRQAGRLALKAGVKKLLIGHFSSKYSELEPFLEETKTVFPATELAIEGNTYELI